MTTDSDLTWRSKVLRRELRRQARNIVGVAESLEQLDDYATRTPPLLCRLIRGTAELVMNNIEACPPTQLQHLGVLLGLMGEHLRYVERSQVAHTPWSMVEAVEAFMGRYVSGDVAFIIRPQWSYNYANEARFVESYRKWIEAFTFIPEDQRTSVLTQFDGKQLYLISFPRVERLNALLHCVWAHELGHTIAANWLTAYFSHIWSAIGTKVDEAARKELNQAAASVQQDLFARTRLEQQVASSVRIAMECTKQALTELIADAFALHVMGPSWFSAAAEIASRSELDSPPIGAGYYPPWRYRLQMMAKHVIPDLHTIETSPSHEALLAPYANWLRGTLSILETGDSNLVLSRDIRTSIAYKEIQDKWDAIRSTALETIPKYDFSAALPRIVELVERLQNQIPPNEHGKWPGLVPASFEDILNAGWIQKLRVVERKDAMEEVSIVNQLVLKAVEVSHLQRIYGKELAL